MIDLEKINARLGTKLARLPHLCLCYDILYKARSENDDSTYSLEIDYICNRFPDSIFESVKNKSTVLPIINRLFSTGYAKIVIKDKILYRCRTCAVRYEYRDGGGSISYKTRVDIIVPTDSSDHILKCSFLISPSDRDNSSRVINKLPGYTIITNNTNYVCIYIGKTDYVINTNDDLPNVIDGALISGLMGLYHVFPACEGFCNNVLEDVNREQGV